VTQQSTIAPQPLRALNYLVDKLAISLCVAVIQKSFGIETPEFKTIEDFASIPLSFFVLSTVVNFLYYFGLEVSSGTTLGKLLTGTEVVMLEGKNKVGTTAIRTLTRFIPAYALICAFSGPVLLHDKFSHTRVMSKPRHMYQ
jgi:uncharacterized RDD family membrane protein YckC